MPRVASSFWCGSGMWLTKTENHLNSCQTTKSQQHAPCFESITTIARRLLNDTIPFHTFLETHQKNRKKIPHHPPALSPSCRVALPTAAVSPRPRRSTRAPCAPGAAVGEQRTVRGRRRVPKKWLGERGVVVLLFCFCFNGKKCLKNRIMVRNDSFTRQLVGLLVQICLDCSHVRHRLTNGRGIEAEEHVFENYHASVYLYCRSY